MSNRPNPILKVILLGDSGVGKSSLINRYVNEKFSENNMQTIGVDLFTKIADVEGSKVTLQIWDTGGQERFRALRTPFYRGADCAVLVYSKDSLQSVDNLNHWRSEFEKHAGNAPILVAMNKSEIENVPSPEGGFQIAEEEGIQHFKVSAKTSQGVNDLFEAAARIGVPTAVERLEESLQQSNIVSIRAQPQVRKSCCK